MSSRFIGSLTHFKACLYGRRDVKWDLAMYVYISLICPVPFIWKECLPGRFSSHADNYADFANCPQGRRETTLIGGGVFIESPEYAIFIKLPE